MPKFELAICLNCGRENEIPLEEKVMGNGIMIRLVENYHCKSCGKNIINSIERSGISEIRKAGKLTKIIGYRWLPIGILKKRIIENKQPIIEQILFKPLELLLYSVIKLFSLISSIIHLFNSFKEHFVKRKKATILTDKRKANAPSVELKSKTIDKELTQSIEPKSEEIVITGAAIRHTIITEVEVIEVSSKKKSNQNSSEKSNKDMV